MKYYMSTLSLIVTLFSFGQQPDYFKGSYQEAIDQAAKGGKHVFIDFYTDWCGWCKRLDATTFKDKAVLDAFGKGYVVFKLNAEKGEGPQIARKFKVSGYPTMGVVDSKGNMVEKIVGYRDAKGLVSILDKHMPKAKEKSRSTDQGAMDNYWMIKSKYLKTLKTDIHDDLGFKASEYIELAEQYATNNMEFEYEELLFETKKEEYQPHVRLAYLLGKGKYEEAQQIVQDMINAQVISDDVLHFYTLKLYEKGFANTTTLQWVNSVALKSEDVNELDTKALIQIALGDFDDAQETGKKAKKIASKKNLDATSIKLLLEANQL